MTGKPQGIKLSSSYVAHVGNKLSKISSLKYMGDKILVFSAILFSVFKNSKENFQSKKYQIINMVLFLWSWSNCSTDSSFLKQ